MKADIAMLADLLSFRTDSYNAKVGALSFAAAAFGTLLLTHFSAPLSPLRLLVLVLASFAVWSFSDEMGLKKPLNRAGMIFFAIATATKAQIVLGVGSEVAARYNLLYAAFLMAALLFWSVAFLHRQKTLKIVGAVGLAASLLPIFAIVAGHLGLGLGVYFGLNALLPAANGASLIDPAFIPMSSASLVCGALPRRGSCGAAIWIPQSRDECPNA